MHNKSFGGAPDFAKATKQYITVHFSEFIEYNIKSGMITPTSFSGN
jgi:hypothetical protein